MYVLFVLDVVYGEYVCWKDYESGIELVVIMDNVVMIWIFFKIYGFVNLCLGWGFGFVYVIDVMNCICGLFNVFGVVIVVGVVVV